MEAPQFSPAGFPARYAANSSGSATVLTHTVTAEVHPDHCFVLQGVDCSSADTGINIDAWIRLRPANAQIFFYSLWVDPATIADLTSAYYRTASWRGNLPFYTPDTCEVGIQTLLPADLAIMAWGVWLPLPLLYSL